MEKLEKRIDRETLEKRKHDLEDIIEKKLNETKIKNLQQSLQ